MYGGDDNDSLGGGAGNDNLYGDQGNDFFQMHTGNDYINGGDNTDTINFTNVNTALDINLSSGLASAIGNSNYNKTIINVENVNGGKQNDMITGDGSSNVLNGHFGNDVIDGGLGSDILWGSTGADTFDFNHTDAVDTVKDFDLAEGDIVDISDLLSGYDPVNDALADFVELTNTGGNTYVAVNQDGIGTDFVQVANLENTVLDLTDLTNSGQIIAA